MADGQRGYNRRISTGDQAILTSGQLIAEIIRNQMRRRGVDRAEQVLQSLGANQGGPNEISGPEFLSQLEQIQATRPESALQQIGPEQKQAFQSTIEPGLLGKIRGERPVQLGGNFDQAHAEIAKIFPGESYLEQSLRREFGGRIEDLRQRSALDSLAPQISFALGIPQDKLNPESLNQVLAVMRTLPTPTGTTYSFATVHDDATNKDVLVRQDKRTGQVEVIPGFAGKQRYGPYFTMNSNTGEQISFGYGPPPKYSPGAAELERGTAKLILQARNQKIFAKQALGAIDRASQLDAEGAQIGGVGGDYIRQMDSVTQQIVKVAKRGGGLIPKALLKYSPTLELKDENGNGVQVIDLFPPELRESAIADTKAASVAYSLAVALARFHNPQSGDVAAREVQRELEYTAGPLLSGSLEQRQAGREELARTLRRDFSYTVQALPENSGVLDFTDEELGGLYPNLFGEHAMTKPPTPSDLGEAPPQTSTPTKVYWYDDTTKQIREGSMPGRGQ